MKNPGKNSSQPSSWFEAHWFRKEKAQTRKGKSMHLWMLTFSLLFYGLVGFLSLPYIQGKVAAMPYFRIHQESLKINALPSWLLPFTQVIEPIDLAPIPTIFTQESARAIAAAYNRNPWVKEVRSVLKRYPKDIEVELVLRKPVALLKCAGGYVPMDEDGIYLPILSEESENSEVLPRLESDSCVLPNPGQKCPDIDILQSLKAISFLTSQGAIELFSLESLRIETLPGSSRKILSLILENDIRILWEELSVPNFFVPLAHKMNALKALPILSIQENRKKMMEVDLRFGYRILRDENPLFPKTKKT